MNKDDMDFPDPRTSSLLVSPVFVLFALLMLLLHSGPP
jgi:hypothetical protein